eukprot:scaffold468_cov133-Skeletonema_menzelii.AAC.4
MIESTTRHEDDHRKCQDTTEKETTTKKKKKKKSSCPVAANPTAAMSSAASSNVTFDNLATTNKTMMLLLLPPPITNEIEADDDEPSPAAIADNTNAIEADDDTPPPAAAATNENEADNDTPPPTIGSPSAAISNAKAHVDTVAKKKKKKIGGPSQKTIDKFVDLPSTDKYCVEVDTEGMWASCKCGSKVKTRSGRPFDISMQLLELGRLEGDKGSTSFDSKVKSFQQRWFRARSTGIENDEKKQTPVEEDAGSIYIERDSLISLTCQRGNASSVEHYRVLAFFTKHYKKWYPSYDPQRFLWGKNSKDVRCLVRMLKMNGSSWKEVELERDGNFGPSCVFRVCSIWNIEC